jgi:hypothetical protein
VINRTELGNENLVGLKLIVSLLGVMASDKIADAVVWSGEAPAEP